ncbi:hypothetical protein BU23DRAFT_5325 [Bimuria novae-zelandiae CBS 107.79]|uniref:Uncharacterized protein n=1 Tax=Bimuria novae-zelandiae CBS 107.79 TaxID=1447943 RepID=A0A6A5VUK7_9PLEO|nr:hypothetical protein BU23DRAFT_5325 [Bimuria novae-zelandiae CBS 107.79]
MCRIEEKVYIGSDGRKRTFEDKFECDRARRRGKRCSKPEKKTREYIGTPPIARDDAPSPASNNPPTPTGVGSYVVEERRPSGSGRRPSLKPAGSVKPEIIIQIGGGSRKDKDKKYSSRKYTSTSYKRSSLGASSTTSNEIVVESPGSDASYPIRTGLPETAVPHTPPFGQPHGYTTVRNVVPKVHRHTASASSVTTSQTPSLYTTSETEPESPLGRHAPVYPRTIVHNSRPAPSSPATTRDNAAQPSAYHTRLEVPHGSSRDTSSSRENPGDYSEVLDFYASSGGSNASSRRAAAPEITDRAIDRERRRKMKEDEEQERRLDAELSKAEEQAKKEVRFAELDSGRYEHRDRLRKEQKLAESEKKRSEEREKERQRKREAEKRTQTEPEKRATRKPEREKAQPPTRDFNKKQSGGRHSRRNSMTQADMDKRDRLLFQEKLQMSLEREAAEQREAAELRQQQYSTRPQPQSTASYQSDTSSYRMEEPKLQGTGGKRRGSISMNPPPVGTLGRTNSTRRASIVQPNPPVLSPLTTSFPPQQPYATRPTSSQTNPQPYTTREALPSARYSPSQLGNPFGQPTARTSNTSMENNPFAAPSDRPIHPTLPPAPVVHHYPGATNTTWDTRGMQNALPAYTAGQASQYAAPGHSRAQQATRNMNQAYQMEDEWR